MGPARIDLLHQLTVALWLNNPRDAMAYASEALELSQQGDDSFSIAKSFRLVGGVYYYQGDFESSLKYNQLALEQAIQLGDSVLINNGYNNVGLLQYNLGNYQTALEYFLISRKIKEAIGEKYGLATTVNNIGLVYERVKDYKTAREYFEEAHLVAIETDNSALRIYSKNNLGTTYLRQNKLDEAEDYFRRALSHSREVGNVNYGSVAMRRIGEVKQLRGEYDSAMYYYTQSLQESQGIDDRRGVSEIYYLLAQLHFARKDSKAAIEALEQSQVIAKDLKLRQQLLDNLKLFSLVYQLEQSPEQSVRYLQEYIHLGDSLFTDVVQRNLALIPVKIQEEDDRIIFARQEAELKRQNSTNRLYTIILLVTVPFVLFLGYLVRKNIISNRILKESNDELKRTQDLLITSEKMASLGLLAAGIGHEINNPLNFIKNGARELYKQMERNGHSMQEVLPFFDAIDEGVKRATAVVKSLSHFSRVGVDMDEQCNIHDIIENCLVILNNNLQTKVTVMRQYDAPSGLVRGNEGKLHQAFLNILTNAEQAIEKQGILRIRTVANDDKVIVSVSDTGVGIPPENLSKISDPFFTTKAPGVGVGLGLFVVYSIVEEHKGRIQVESVTNKGTTVTVELPSGSVG